MLKKICTFIIAAFVLLSFSISAFGAPVAGDGKDDILSASSAKKLALENELAEASKKLQGIMASKDTASTEQFLITITNPVGDKADFEKTVMFIGYSNKADLSVSILVYDEQAEKYVECKDIDDLSSWDMPVRSTFRREVQLKEGTNKIRIVSYVKSDIKELKAGTNLQVNNFSITVLKENSKGNRNRGFINYIDVVKGII